jgi:hypothetical protein
MKTVTHKVLPSSVFLIGLGAGLWIPDTDLILLPVLHHRSIVTHSILIPWLLSLTAGGRVPLSTVAGLYGGIAIHLAADATSATVGFGMVWLPWPIKTALGAFSPVWLLGNAAAAVWLMFRIQPGFRIWMVAAAVAVAGAYATLNEFAFAPFILFGLIIFGVSWVKLRRERRAGCRRDDSAVKRGREGGLAGQKGGRGYGLLNPKERCKHFFVGGQPVPQTVPQSSI